MKRAQIRQLAELAETTRDADLMAKAIQLLLAEMDKPDGLPLFHQPAVASVESHASLHQALDNLPPLVVKQPAVMVVERDTELDVVKSVRNALEAWRVAFGDAWRSNSEAIGAHQHRQSYLAQLHTWIDLAVEATPDMTGRAKMRTFWERVRMMKPEGFRIEHRVRQCGTYNVNEHRVLEARG